MLADSTKSPTGGTPRAVSLYRRQERPEGIVMENWAGRAVATLLDPRGSSPWTTTPEKIAPAGEVTATLTV